jgi:hypothetical protein
MNRAGHGHQKHNSQSEKAAGKSDEPSDLSGDRDAFPVNGGGTKGARGENWGGSVASPLRIHVPAMPAHPSPRLSAGKLRIHGKHQYPPRSGENPSPDSRRLRPRYNFRDSGWRPARARFPACAVEAGVWESHDIPHPSPARSETCMKFTFSLLSGLKSSSGQLCPRKNFLPRRARRQHPYRG